LHDEHGDTDNQTQTGFNRIYFILELRGFNMPDRKLQDTLEDLKNSQNTEKDNRDKVREADLFLNKRDGQWDPYTVVKMSGKPKYTFDQCNPILDDIMGEMESMDFGIAVKPSGGEATKESAEQYAGIVRNIESISEARYIYKDAARVMTGTGLSGWRVVTKYRESDSFQQDLMVQPVSNFKDRVWYDDNADKRTMEDAPQCWVLSSMTRKAYDKKYPKGSGVSVGREKNSQAYDHKKSNEVIIGEWLHKKKEKRELALLSNNKVVVVDEKFELVRDDLFNKNIKVERTRTVNVDVVYQSIFDGADWLTEDVKTVFKFLPIVPIYANFVISEDKVVYWGLVEKLMDPQRVLNFAESRKVEEAALSPREKTWLTKDQAQSTDVIAALRTANTNMDSHQLYDHVPNQPPPFRHPKQQPNNVLLETANSSERYMSRTMPEESRGLSVKGRSGLAMQQLINKGNNSNYKYFTATEIGIAHTCRIIIDAIPKVYDTRQEMTIMGEDGTTDTFTLKDRVIDQETGEIVELNNLAGSYTVVCSSGPAFTNKQQETVQSIIDVAGIAPDVVNQGSDILVKNIDSPGMDQLAERIRLQKVLSGQIPESQLTDEEKEMVKQASQQGQQPSAVDQALIAESEARATEVEAKTADTISKIEERQDKALLKNKEIDLKYQTEQSKLILDTLESQTNQINIMAQTLKTLREAQGVDAIVAPETVEAFAKQAKLVTEAQDDA
jgi:hypothetical protein